MKHTASYMLTRFNMGGGKKGITYLTASILTLLTAACSSDTHDSHTASQLTQQVTPTTQSFTSSADSTLHGQIQGQWSVASHYHVGESIAYDLYGDPQCHISADSLRLTATHYQYTSISSSPQVVEQTLAAYHYQFQAPNLFVLGADTLRILPSSPNRYKLEGKEQGIVIEKKSERI